MDNEKIKPILQRLVSDPPTYVLYSHTTMVGDTPFMTQLVMHTYLHTDDTYGGTRALTEFKVYEHRTLLFRAHVLEQALDFYEKLWETH